MTPDRPTSTTPSPTPVAATGMGGWRLLVHRLVLFWPLKAVGMSGFMTLFFWAYFEILNHPRTPPWVMPLTGPDHWVGLVPWAYPVYLSLWLYVYLAPSAMGNLRALVWYGVWVGAMCLFCLGIFWWFPTQTPVQTIDWTLHPGLSMIKGVDAAGNAFPSLHVASAVFSACWLQRVITQLRGARWLVLLSYAHCLAIMWSTLATLQHVALDVLGGTVVGLVFAALSLRHIQDTRSAAER